MRARRPTAGSTASTSACCVGYAYDETLAVAALVFGGVLDRHPDLDVCVSHGGGAMPFLVERFELAAATRPWIPDGLRDGGFRRALQRLWLDTHVDGQARATRPMLVAMVGTERLVFGTNFGGWDSAHGEATEPFVEGLSGNAERLLRLVPRRRPPEQDLRRTRRHHEPADPAETSCS